MSALAAAERWLVRAIAGEREPADRDRRLGGTRLSPAIGLGIYRAAYRIRLRECLADDFPVLAAWLGEARFRALAEAVIAAHPPADATLNRYGRRLVQWLRAHPAAYGCEAGALARLEWALVEAVHAPLAPPLDAVALAALPPAAWGRLRLRGVPSLRLIALRRDVDALVGRHWRGEAVGEPGPGPLTVAVLRRAGGCERHRFAPAEGRLLHRLARGASLSDALAGCRLDAGGVQAAFARFIASGCLAGCAWAPPA